MAAGATRIVRDLVAAGKAHAILSLGGTQGTTLSTAVMRALPYGFPKVMVSTMASGNVAPWVDTSDITMMYSVTDIMGLNPFMRRILANAAARRLRHGGGRRALPRQATSRSSPSPPSASRRPGAMKAVEVLERAGYETIVFHAVGTGGRAMEEMMQAGHHRRRARLLDHRGLQRDVSRPAGRRRRSPDDGRPARTAAGDLPRRASRCSSSTSRTPSRRSTATARSSGTAPRSPTSG